MALHPRADEVTPTDVHLVITPTARGQDLYTAIALPSNVSCRDARRAARDMRRSAQGPRLEGACLAEVVLGEPAHRQAYDELRARAAAAGVPLPMIGASMPASTLPPPARVRFRKWAIVQAPKVRDELDKALTVTGRFTIGLIKALLAIALFVLAAYLLARYGGTGGRTRYDPPPRYEYRPPVIDFKIPEYQVPKFEMPEIKVPRFDPPQ